MKLADAARFSNVDAIADDIDHARKTLSDMSVRSDVLTVLDNVSYAMRVILTHVGDTSSKESRELVDAVASAIAGLEAYEVKFGSELGEEPSGIVSRIVRRAVGVSALTLQ